MCGGYLDLEPTTDCPALQPFSGGSRNFEGGVKNNVSALSSFVTNAHDKLRAFYTGKDGY